MTKYEDFDSDKMERLKKTVLSILDREGTLYNHELAEDKLDVEDFGWNKKGTFKMALSKLRDKLEKEGEITVDTENTDSVAKKKEWRRNPEKAVPEAGNK